ncbi:MAG: DedA family protein [Deltaproteobacteria bacterium]|nr:DedA family protein [Deltaproteobacteria bacterium]
MEIIQLIIDVVLHLDRHLGAIVGNYGQLTYLILFCIIFLETGVVVTPFLPGDSLLFAAGSLAALGVLDPAWLFILLSIAAILGDTVNYWIGHKVGPKVFHRDDTRWFKREHLDRTHRFYEKYGGKTIIIARFVPFVRTFAPFVAGIGAMSYGRFIMYNVAGGLAWTSIFIFGGYHFGNLPVIKRNFSLVILTIIILSIMPGIIEFIRARRAACIPSCPVVPDSLPGRED